MHAPQVDPQFQRTVVVASKFDNRLKEFSERWEVDRSAGLLALKLTRTRHQDTKLADLAAAFDADTGVDMLACACADI